MNTDIDNVATELESVFEKANEKFIQRNLQLFESKVSERTLCGALMLELYNAKCSTKYHDYFVDVEYNRNRGGKLKTMKKTIIEPQYEIVTINCDLIIHSRGTKSIDNLIAIEMKKSSAKKKDKSSDRVRLECLTKSNSEMQNDVWEYDKDFFPEHVCNYGLGIYYEINFGDQKIMIEYYKRGRVYKKYSIDYNVCTG